MRAGKVQGGFVVAEKRALLDSRQLGWLVGGQHGLTVAIFVFFAGERAGGVGWGRVGIAGRLGVAGGIFKGGRKRGVARCGTGLSPSTGIRGR